MTPGTRATISACESSPSARLAESFGEVPIIRWARDITGSIAGVELALLPREDQASRSIIAIHPGELDGMAVVGAE